jgi:hypothetical protein
MAWVQLSLFQDAAARSYRWGRVDLRHGPAPDNPWLAWALHLAHAMAELRGFGPDKRSSLNRVLVMLLADHADGETVRISDFEELVHRYSGSVLHTAEVLSSMGILVDDRTPVFDTWLADKLESFNPGIRSETEQWVRTLHDGSPRSHPRPALARVYLYAALPALAEWSIRLDHLREVTRDDVLAYADSLVGRQRQMALCALRSLFAWAKKGGVVFANPAGRIRVSRIEGAVWQPLRPEEIAQAIEMATTAQARLVVALATVHAARSGAMRTLQLDDFDLGNRRLTIAGRTRPLDELTGRLLVEWLDHRRSRWPNTANRHLFISRQSAVNLGPISQHSISLNLRGLPATLERLRIDRQLEEALTYGADPLHLASVFDINPTTAMRYAASARQLLERPHEAGLISSSRTQVSDDRIELPHHSGSE